MRIKNWHEFQHFKNRTPPWIKLHRTVLERRDISVISDCSFRVLIGLWLLASEDQHMEGQLPEVPEIAFRLRIEEPKIIKALQELEPFIDGFDISVISPRYQSDAPETEGETEGETEERHKNPCRAESPKAEVVREIIGHLNQKAGKSFKPVESNAKFIRARLGEGHTPGDIRAVIDRKCLEWANDPERCQYLRPATLFNAEKFNQYVGELDRPLPLRVNGSRNNMTAAEHRAEAEARQQWEAQTRGRVIDGEIVQ